MLTALGAVILLVLAPAALFGRENYEADKLRDEIDRLRVLAQEERTIAARADAEGRAAKAAGHHQTANGFLARAQQLEQHLAA